ncbi:hypothetical protein [Halobacillus mangrovi]|uniref:Uncharacterized protein n=1 Tax=Halobacillus mangrovi TaxID=402384 RepID=A0A1W5ZZY6_9BACI|nr:hypothetical protein [Halobacillus mangrovi]ARI78807.1 hypothetical protein HM131_19060 [Halobacillus mangrovi]
MALDTFFQEQEESNWLDTLPNYQRDLVNELLSYYSYEEAAVTWLESSTSNTSPFSGQPQPEKKYFEYVKKEVHKLLCGDTNYEAERHELVQLAQKPENKNGIIAMVSALIGAKLGLAATFLAPVIVIIFLTIGKISLNAWCTMESSTN